MKQLRGSVRWCMLFRLMASATVLVKFFGLAFSALLPLINPLGSALIFLGLVGTAPPAVLFHLARRIAFSTVLFLGFVELVGTAFLTFFGISLPVVQVAGGLVLASMGWSVLNQQQAESRTDKTEAAESCYGSLEEQVFYPLTFPVTAGPGCIVITLTLSAHASAQELLANVMAHLGIFLAIVALSFTVLLAYGYAPKITAKVSPQTAHGILRVIAFVLLCIGVQITWNGVQALLRTALKS